jgi:hypothetical protein
MIGVGLFGVLLTPIFFYVIMRSSRALGQPNAVSGQRGPQAHRLLEEFHR